MYALRAAAAVVIAAGGARPCCCRNEVPSRAPNEAARNRIWKEPSRYCFKDPTHPTPSAATAGPPLHYTLKCIANEAPPTQEPMRQRREGRWGGGSAFIDKTNSHPL